ncbi:MAG: 4Fe-4S binding protein [Anaerolineales bacterium]|nr:4Fe-4S binding protein [Chloroflexota bacterium]MBL6980257.1 4Fe-4S binding protein [Anaerolineales bacterium]
MSDNPYQLLAKRLDALPNGFPPTEDGAELRLLEKIFTPEQAALAAQLRLTVETPDELADRIAGDPSELKKQLKVMARKGLITVGRAEGGIGYGLLPFVVGIYEYQLSRIDSEMAQLFEDYYQQAFTHMLSIEPSVHRVIPVDETVKTGMEVRPFESATEILSNANSWGFQDCICRKQKELINDPCDHPIDNCMVFHKRPDAFANIPFITTITKDEAMVKMKEAANAGLVHSVSNTQEGAFYVCNCCTCSCGILRGMSEMGIANVVARSAFVNTVDEDLCQGCEDCIEYCQFNALALHDDAMLININTTSCVGCGVCVPVCPEVALVLVRRPEEEVLSIPVTEEEWLADRAAARGVDINAVL